MENFHEYARKVDEHQIDTLYDKGHISVEIVNMYNPNLLLTISTIADLASGSYGLYNSAENKKNLPPDIERWLIYRGVKKQDIPKLPSIILQKWGINSQSVQIGNTIHVNIRRILPQAHSNLEAVLQIASTIVHEATHNLERENTGKTSEVGPKQAEHHFMQWAKQHLREIQQRYPELNVNN